MTEEIIPTNGTSAEDVAYAKKVKEIYIDGVDVAGCEHYCEKLDTGSGIIKNTSKQGFCLHNITGLHNADIYFRVLSFPKCREQSNCYFKQLKRLEQENKELKEENKTLNYQWHKQSEIGDEWYKVADKYKTALEEISDMFLNQVAWVGQLTNFEEEIYNKINEVLQCE